MSANFPFADFPLPPEEQFFEVIVKYHGDILAVAGQLDIDAEVLTPSYAILTLNAAQLEALRTFTEIEYIELPKSLFFLLNEALLAACITQVHDRQGLTGAGTAVGIIDSGVDYTHPDFRHSDGASRIAYFWDQTAPGGPPPSGFSAGVEYTAAELNAALASGDPLAVIPQLDTLGHGTAVAGVAAGNGRASRGMNEGVAPAATLIVVRLGQRGRESFARTTEVMRAIKYCIEKATEMNLPLSINLSYGTNDGSHDGNSLFETYIDDMANRWKTVISVASGNEGFAGHHYRGVATEGGTLTVQFIIGGQINELYLTLWKNYVDTFYFELISPAEQSSGRISPEDQVVSFTLDGADITVFYGQPTEYNEAQEVFFQFRSGNGTVTQGLWMLNIYASQVVDGVFDIWLPVTEQVSTETAFLRPDLNTTITLPATANNVIAVGGYNSHINAITDFTGRGYTRSIVYVKPDLVAPAVAIITTRPGGGYDTFSGTSIAAPFVTGSAALLMEWGIVRGNDPFLYGQKVKAVLQKGARRSPGIRYPNREWGYGALCLAQTMTYLI